MLQRSLLMLVGDLLLALQARFSAHRPCDPCNEYRRAFENSVLAPCDSLHSVPEVQNEPLRRRGSGGPDVACVLQSALARQAAELYDTHASKAKAAHDASKAEAARAQAHQSSSAAKLLQSDEKTHLRLELKQTECDSLVAELQKLRRERSDSTELYAKCAEQEEELRRLRTNLDGNRKQHFSELSRLHSALHSSQDQHADQAALRAEISRLGAALDAESEASQRARRTIENMRVHELDVQRQLQDARQTIDEQQFLRGPSSGGAPPPGGPPGSGGPYSALRLGSDESSGPYMSQVYLT